MKLDAKSGKIAFSSIFSAMSAAMLFLGSLLPTLEYSAVALAGMCLIPIVIEVGKRYSVTAFAATSILGLILAPNKEVAMLFALFFGYYPILKSVFESIKSKAIEFALKFAVFNAAMIAVFFVTKWLLGVDEESYTIFGVYLPWLFLAVGNVVFILYDFCLTQLIILYVKVIRDKVIRRL